MSHALLRFDVVILGGGFAGVYCAQALAKKMGADARTRVALVADENFMVFQPMLPEIAGSALSPRHVVNPIRRLCPDVTVLRAKVHDIDLGARRVALDAGDFTENSEVYFDHLAIAIGGIVDLSRVPGMPEHAYLMKNVGDALKLRSAVIDRFEEANLAIEPEEQKRLLTFVVVGGGYSGVETAGQLFDFAKEMLGAYSRVPREALRVVLIHSGPHLLPEISRSLGQYTEENLRGRGLELKLNTRVTAMTASRVMFAEGGCIETHTVVSTVGNAPNPVLTQLCRKLDLGCEKGRLLVEPTLRLKGVERVWAAGDCAAVPMAAKNGQHRDQPPAPAKIAPSPFEPRPYCPPTAQFALRQGTLMGANIYHSLHGGDEIKPFTFTGLGELASIGHLAAVAEIAGMKFQGFIAWWLWRTIYLMKLPGLERKLRVMVEWTLDLFFPRDIATFQGRPTLLLKEMHLETGDEVFRAGDPAWSLYIVKVGVLELKDKDGTVLRTVSKGEQVGRKTLLEGRVWRFSATATQPTTLVAVSGKIFETVTSAGLSVEEVFGAAVNTKISGAGAEHAAAESTPRPA